MRDSKKWAEKMLRRLKPLDRWLAGLSEAEKASIRSATGKEPEEFYKWFVETVESEGRNPMPRTIVFPKKPTRKKAGS